MPQAIDILSDIVREELPNMFIDLEPELAPMFEKIKRTSVGVKSQEGIGKAFEVIHLYETGTAGLFRSADPMGPAMTSITGNQAQLLALGTAASNLDIFPSAMEVPHTGEVKRTLKLHKVTGNYSIPVAWKTLDTLNAAQLKKVQRDLMAVAKAKILYSATSFFSHEVTNSSGYANQVLGRIGAVAEWSGEDDYVVITLDEQYGRIANFAKGQPLDIVADSGGTLQDGTATNGTDVRNYTHTGGVYIRLYVSDVDYLGKKIILAPVNSVTGAKPNYAASQSGEWAALPAVGDWIVYAGTTTYTAGSRPQETWGLNNWIKETGTIMGGDTGDSGLDVDMYPMFKSRVAAINQSMTDAVMTAKVAGYLDAYPGESLDTIITTQGVQQQWIKQTSQYNNRMVYDRTGKALSFVGGWARMEYEFGGRVFEKYISPMCLAKTMYVLKLGGNNVLRYGPPKIGGSNASMGPELDFLAPLGGHTGIFKIANSSTGQPLDLLEAPFWYYELLAPRDPRGIKMTNITEAQLY